VKKKQSHREKCLEAAQVIRAKRYPGVLDFEALEGLSAARTLIALLGVIEKQGVEIKRLQRQMASMDNRKKAKKT
jgi:hypothetical protein